MDSDKKKVLLFSAAVVLCSAIMWGFVLVNIPESGSSNPIVGLVITAYGIVGYAAGIISLVSLLIFVFTLINDD